MFESDPIKKAAARAAQYEKQKAKRIQEEENPKSPANTFSGFVGFAALMGAATNQQVQEVGGVVLDKLKEAVGGRELLVDLPPAPVQADMPPGPTDSDAHIAKLNTDDVPNNGEGR